MLDSILSTATTTTAAAVGMNELILCTLASMALGIGVALCYMFRNTYSKSFVVTLALMPVIIQTIIMLVNGNLGTGIAVMGAFNLVRFRSVPGSAREIGSIFFAMAAGLACGMGYLGYAALFLVMVGAVMLLLNAADFGSAPRTQRELKITIPEGLDYEGIFDDLLLKYTTRAELERVRTTNMGSLYELCYLVELKGDGISKALIDELRCRNENLNITCGRISSARDEL